MARREGKLQSLYTRLPSHAGCYTNVTSHAGCSNVTMAANTASEEARPDLTIIKTEQIDWEGSYDCNVCWLSVRPMLKSAASSNGVIKCTACIGTNARPYHRACLLNIDSCTVCKREGTLKSWQPWRAVDGIVHTLASRPRSSRSAQPAFSVPRRLRAKQTAPLPPVISVPACCFRLTTMCFYYHKHTR